MKLIVPMAGRGKRLRPQSSVTPKPLMTVRGKCMVERIVEGFADVLPRPLTDGVFIIGPGFGQSAYDTLEAICARHGLTAHFVIQEEALGTGHAVAVTGDHLSGEGIVVYADTVFAMAPVDHLDRSDVVAWVKEVEDPSRFGVAVREEDRVVAFVEKPQDLISNEALIGIYYVRELEQLRTAIQVLFDQGIRGKGGEYYLTDAFDHMLKQGLVFRTASVDAWLDCGTLEAFMDTTRELLRREPQGADRPACTNSALIEPVFIGTGAKVTDSVIGPYVCIEAGATVERAIVRDSILFEAATVRNAVLRDSLVGAHSEVVPGESSVNIGDYSQVR